MSGGLVFTHFLHLINSYDISLRTRRAIVAVAYSLDPAFIQFIYEAGVDANLENDILLSRAAAIMFEFAAVQLSDDLSDGDCTYLDNPLIDGPVIQALLQNLFHYTILISEVPVPNLKAALELITIVAQWQQSELHTATWTYTKAVATARGLNGMQMSAYLEILWAATKLGPSAHTIGLNFGIALHIATDIVAKDRRFWALNKSDKSRLVNAAKKALSKADALEIPSIKTRRKSLFHTLTHSSYT